MIETHHCEVCGNYQLDSVLNLGTHPLCDDLIAIEDARTCREYPIEILFCDHCKTAHQRYQVPKRDLFPSTYHYRSRFTADVLNGMSELAATCDKTLGGVAGKLVLDVGCNDGSLLDCFMRLGARTVGIEPTGACADAESKGHITFNEFLAPELAQRIVDKHGQPDVIVFTNVFAHIENLADVVVSLKKLLSSTSTLVIENHYLGGVLAGNQFDTFYHEHPRTYSCTSFVKIAESLDAKLVDVSFPSRYGGNIRVTLSRGAKPLDEEKLRAVLKTEESFGEQIRAMQAGVQQWCAVKRQEIRQHVQKHGKLHAKAFPGRAAILVKLLDLDSDLIEGAYEKPGSMKIGHYIPGTRIPIRSDDDFQGLAEKPPVILNLAWHISREIREYLIAQGFRGEVIDILSQRDFRAVG